MSRLDTLQTALEGALGDLSGSLKGDGSGGLSGMIQKVDQLITENRENISKTTANLQSITDKPLKKCPACGKPKLRRAFGAGAAILFKGSGFNQTDYRSESYKSAAKADQEKSSGSADTNGAAAEAGTLGGGRHFSSSLRGVSLSLRSRRSTRLPTSGRSPRRRP